MSSISSIAVPFKWKNYSLPVRLRKRKCNASTGFYCHEHFKQLIRFTLEHKFMKCARGKSVDLEPWRGLFLVKSALHTSNTIITFQIKLSTCFRLCGISTCVLQLQVKAYNVYGFNIILESATLPAKTLNMLYLKPKIGSTGLFRGFEVKSSYFLCLK